MQKQLGKIVNLFDWLLCCLALVSERLYAVAASTPPTQSMPPIMQRSINIYSTSSKSRTNLDNEQSFSSANHTDTAVHYPIGAQTSHNEPPKQRKMQDKREQSARYTNWNKLGRIGEKSTQATTSIAREMR